MEQYIMKGGNPLVGDVTISGAKNAALGILAASCILGTVFLMQNRKPAVLLTADGKDSRELVLNRKGGVIRKNGNPDSMAGLSLRECCERLLEELHGVQMLGDQEAALFTVRPIEGARCHAHTLWSAWCTDRW